MTQLIIPHFISHQGCPHQCLFCNQKSITGVESGANDGEGSLLDDIEEWLPRRKAGQVVQLAFYGGSFTCLPSDTQKKKLQVAQPYLQSGAIDSIRLSTRPDCITDELCDMLAGFGVDTIELGVQSMADDVLERSQRGHDTDDIRNAVTILHQHRFNIGIQLLPGLPGDSWGKFMKGVKEVVALQPSFVRIYPALVMRKSGLEKLYEKGEYTPLTLNQAVAWACRAKLFFKEAGIPVIRLGLQHSDSLTETLIAGPYHPAFGELVESRRWFKRIRAILSGCGECKFVEVRISDKDLSAFNGPKRKNIQRLEKLNLTGKMKLVVDSNIGRGRLEYAVCK